MNEIYPKFASAGCISSTPTSSGNILDHLFAPSTPEDVRRLVFSALSHQELNCWLLVSRSMKEVIEGIRQEKLLRCASRFIETVMSYLENQKQGDVSTKTPRMAKLESTFLGLASILVNIQSVKTCLSGITKYGLDLQRQIVDQLAKLPEADLVCLLDLPQAVEKHRNIDDLARLALVDGRIMRIYSSYPDVVLSCDREHIDVITAHLPKFQHIENVPWVLKKFQREEAGESFLKEFIVPLVKEEEGYEKACYLYDIWRSERAPRRAQIVSIKYFDSVGLV